VLIKLSYSTKLELKTYSETHEIDGKRGHIILEKYKYLTYFSTLLRTTFPAVLLNTLLRQHQRSRTTYFLINLFRPGHIYILINPRALV